MKGLYIHCPFCASKCYYCDFYSVVGAQDMMDAFVEAVTAEAQSHMGMSFRTVYFGGGTPSLLGPARLQRLMQSLGDIFDLRQIHEGTIEVNPESASTVILRVALASGLQRLSIGVQSLSDRELQAIGRIHTGAQAVATVARARKTGFRNISVDLMVGLPGQDWPSLKRSLTVLLDLGIAHISLYCLSLEPGTALARNQPRDLPSDDCQADLFEAATSLLMAKGFRHYEISSFALEGFECQHNLNYWRCGEYLGLGPAASSHLLRGRKSNRCDLRAYLSDPLGQSEEIEELDPKRKVAEEAMLRLRLLLEGVASYDLTGHYGEENASRVIHTLDDLTEREFLHKSHSTYRLLPSKVLTSNPVFAALIEQ